MIQRFASLIVSLSIRAEMLSSHSRKNCRPSPAISRLKKCAWGRASVGCLGEPECSLCRFLAKHFTLVENSVKHVAAHRRSVALLQ